jgi:hypothetical protein
MILQKKQAYLNKVLSKHYKKLRYTLFSKTKNIPAFKTMTILSGQSIGISMLTIDTISHKDFPDIVDVTIFNGLKKKKKAVIIYKGKATVPTLLTRSISKPAQAHSKNQKPKKDTSNEELLGDRSFSKSINTLGVIDKMLGAGITMHNYQLCFNSHLSFQHFNNLKSKQTIKLKDLDRLAATLIFPQCTSETNPKNAKTQNQETLRKKEVRLSKTELSSVIAQVLHKIQFFKGRESLGEGIFNIQKLSNVLGAFVEINSEIYFISDKELKQCGLAGGFKHSAFHSSAFHNNTASLLKDLVYSKMPTDKTLLLETKSIQPNIIFFNFLNIVTRTYIIHNIKRILSKLINTLSFLALGTSLPKKQF